MEQVPNRQDEMMPNERDKDEAQWIQDRLNTSDNQGY